MKIKLSTRLKYYQKIYRSYDLDALLFLMLRKFKRDKLSNIRLKNIKYPVSISNYGTDVNTLFQIFFAGEYNIAFKTAPSFIIDCGANIGLSAFFFANKYPEAKIIAVEPDKKNFEYLKINTAVFKNVVCVNKAIWSHSASIKVIDPGFGNWGLQTIESLEKSDQDVEGISIDMILKEHKVDKIDLLKIDIEGAEKELFSKNYESWLAKTKMLAIELHDTPNNNVSVGFFKAVNIYPHSSYQLGENLIFDFNPL